MSNGLLSIKNMSLPSYCGNNLYSKEETIGLRVALEVPQFDPGNIPSTQHFCKFLAAHNLGWSLLKVYNKYLFQDGLKVNIYQ